MTLPFDLIVNTIRSAYEENNEDNKLKDQDILRILWAFGTDLKDLYDGISSKIEIPSEILHILQRLDNEQYESEVVEYLNNNGFTLYDIVKLI